MLIELVKKYREILDNNHEYVLCNKILTKLASSMITTDNDDVKLELLEICNLSKEELSMFSSSECQRIIDSMRVVSQKKGWRVETVVKLIKKLQQDILENKMHDFKRQRDGLDELYKIIDQRLYVERYNLVLDFIKLGFENKLLSITEAINLNFYVLEQCSNYKNALEQEDDIKTLELYENIESDEIVRKSLYDIFSKYGYIYDPEKMGDLDDRIVKFVNLKYVDYVLSKFVKYGVENDEIYIRKRAIYNIIMDGDWETFDSILDFVDSNECSLSYLLSVPAIFAKNRKKYVEKNITDKNKAGVQFEVFGANSDFFDNMAIYKERSGVSVIKSSDLESLGKFLCTPTGLIKRNLLLLERYNIITKGTLPKAIFALCGNDTEYIIDRFIETGLYEDYLCARINKNGEVKQARGTYFLNSDNNPFKFYKMKRANDIGVAILASNGGIKKVFKDNNEEFMGITSRVDDSGKIVISQKPLSMDTMSEINMSVKKSLPEVLQHKIDEGRIHRSSIGPLCFNNLYKYKTFNPIEIFAASDKNSVTNLKGDRVSWVFKNDYRDTVSDDEMEVVSMDSFIQLLDTSGYSDSDGNFKPLKTSEFKYEFSYPGFPNINIIISRQKVLRLCKLLKDNGCWINQESSNVDKENTLLSVIIKDTIISDTEMIVLRLAVRQFLANQIIKVSEIKETNEKRGARR